jgi:hypothetical protein
MAKIRGIPIEMGGAEFVVPPLTVGQIRECKEDRATVSREGADEVDVLEAAARIIHAAFARNYPDVTLDVLERDLLDMGNYREVLGAVLFGSGLRPAVSGEAMAARTGPASTGSSPLPAATDPATSTN